MRSELSVSGHVVDYIDPKNKGRPEGGLAGFGAERRP
jgi:hypothetical protein